jgi:NTE family protein
VGVGLVSNPYECIGPSSLLIGRSHHEILDMIKNLAIKGGGVKGVAYVGALKELDKVGLFQPIERVSGTSAGALMASMICAGYDIPGIEKLMMSIKFDSFKSGWNPIRIFTRYGLYSGDYILKFVSGILSGSPLGLKKDATFADLRKTGCKDLYVFACNTTMHDVTEFSIDRTPDVPIAYAVRASMSIPLYFKAWQFPGNNPNNHIYVDGGVVYNYPLSFFDDARFNKQAHVNFESIGLYLYSKTPSEGMPLKFSSPIYFTGQLVESLLATQDYVILHDKEQRQRSVLIDDLMIPATDFGITDKQKDDLMESGKRATREFIARIADIEQKLPLTPSKLA